MFINDGITLESFFLADYVRLRDRVKELEDEVDRLSPNGYGCIDNDLCGIRQLSRYERAKYDRYESDG